MEQRKRHFFSYGWRWLGVLALTTLLFMPVDVLAAEVEVYKGEHEGMNVRVWLDKPMKMSMLMQQKWMTFRPKAGALTHHLGIDLTDSKGGGAIPTAVIKATLTHRASGKRITKDLPAMFGKRFIYGANLKLEKGKYDAVVKIEPPTIMRMGPSINQWLSAVEVKFTFDVD